MTISNNYTPDKSPGNGVTVLFTGNWSPLAEDYMRVALEEIATGDLGPPLVLGADYDLTFDEDGYEVDLTPMGAPSALYNVVRYREVELDQEVPLKTSKGFQGKVSENIADKGIAIDQDQQDQIDRTIKLQIGSTAGPIILADPIAGRGLMVDPSDPTKIIMSSANLEDLVAIAVAAASAAAASAAAAAASAAAASTSATNAANSAAAAAASAALAQSWAIDPIGLRPEGSAKYWAEQAANIAGGLTVTWGGTSTNIGNQYTVAPSPAIVNAPGKILAFFVNTPNTGGGTIVVNGAAAANIRKKVGGAYTNLRPNDLHTFAVLMGDGTNWILLNPAPTSNAADLASSATLDLTFATPLGGGDYLNITGTTGISAITLLEGQERTLRFAASLRITNGASLVCLGNADMLMSAGDFITVRGEASGVVRVIDYTPAIAPQPGNILINGGFDVWQRNTTFAVSTKLYTADRWAGIRSGGGQTVSRQAGFGKSRYCMRLQRDSGNASATALTMVQGIESQDSIPLAGTPVFLVIKARAGANYSGGGTFQVAIISGTGTDEDPTGTYTGQAAELTLSGTPTVGGITLSGVVNIAAAKTELKLRIIYTPPASAAGAADYVEITDILWGRGGVVQDYEPPLFVEELDRCLRFYEKSFLYATVPAVALMTSTAGAVRESTPNRTDRFGIGWTKPFQVRKRTTPTCVVFGNAATARVYDAGGGADRAVIVTASESTISVDGDVAVTTTANATHAWQFTADAEL